MLEWYDQWSDSSRVMPHSRAVFSPTVMSMFMFGASGESGWLGRDEPLDAPEGEGGPFEHERRAGHRLDAAGDDRLGHARADVGRRLLHRHHPRGALALHRAARRVGRQAQGVGDVARGAPAALEHLAEDQVVDVIGLEPGRRDGGRHRLRADVLQAQARQAPAGTPDRGADGGDDDGVVGIAHDVLLRPARRRGW